ncbi:hypothetical protein JQX13_08005 [Archangium violaceum]|uniref:hypothetical protein n=1 Tax=Archangium violaceum TaxID=83451 RepID=UPI00193B26D2|nr:hypothetical protein [Archangium violaceum]QRK10030.1 hypothetical protein JQX13_08005 [Archangium violaceum]
MGPLMKTVGGMFLGKYLNQRQRQRQRRGAWSRGRAYKRTRAGGILGTFLGRLGLGSMAFLAARQFMARQRHA